MKIKYVLPVILIAIIIFAVILAAKKSRLTDMTNLTYEQLCNKNDDQWMVMEPWKDGKRISDTACAGCMIGGNHFCTAEEYIAYVKNLPTIGVQETTAMEEMDRTMMHQAMTAHGGSRNSADIHLYDVEFLRNKLLQNEIAFNITEIASGNPVSGLEIVHDKIIHLILVRDDLEYFDHIHPQQTSPGIYSVPYEFYATGTYRLWADFTIDGMQHIVDFDANVSTNRTSEEPDRLYRLDVAINSSNFKTDDISKIDFTVTDGGRPARITERFLAANAHMIIIDESLDEFGHAHDEQFDNDNILSFEHMFARTGLHKLWVQFSVNGTERTAEFVVNVNA